MPANSRWDLIQHLNNLNDPVLNVLIEAARVDVCRRYIMPMDVTDFPTSTIYVVLLAPLKGRTKENALNCTGRAVPNDTGKLLFRI